MIDHETTTSTRGSAKRWGSAAALMAAGLAGGIVIAGTVSANAATGTPSPSASSSTSAPSGITPPSGSSSTGTQGQGRPAETELTGDTAAKVKAAALAKYPGATVDRVETDSEGVYEAHVTTTDGTHVIVAVDKTFTVTGTQELPAGGPGDGQGGPGGGHGPDGSSPSAAPSSSSTA